MSDGEAKYARVYDIQTRLKSLSRDDWDTEEVAHLALAEIERLSAALREIVEVDSGNDVEVDAYQMNRIAKEALND